MTKLAVLLTVTAVLSLVAGFGLAWPPLGFIAFGLCSGFVGLFVVKVDDGPTD